MFRISSGFNVIALRDLVINKHININTTDEERTSPLHISTRYGSLQMIEEILNIGANINFPDLEGWTSLHIACYFKRPEVILLLLNFNADILSKNRNGECPFDFISNKDYECSEVITNFIIKNNVCFNIMKENNNLYALSLNNFIINYECNDVSLCSLKENKNTHISKSDTKIYLNSSINLNRNIKNYTSFKYMNKSAEFSTNNYIIKDYFKEKIKFIYNILNKRYKFIPKKHKYLIKFSKIKTQEILFKINNLKKVIYSKILEELNTILYENKSVSNNKLKKFYEINKRLNNSCSDNNKSRRSVSLDSNLSDKTVKLYSSSSIYNNEVSKININERNIYTIMYKNNKLIKQNTFTMYKYSNIEKLEYNTCFDKSCYNNKLCNYSSNNFSKNKEINRNNYKIINKYNNASCNLIYKKNTIYDNNNISNTSFKITKNNTINIINTYNTSINKDSIINKKQKKDYLTNSINKKLNTNTNNKNKNNNYYNVFENEYKEHNNIKLKSYKTNNFKNNYSICRVINKRLFFNSNNNLLNTNYNKLSSLESKNLKIENYANLKLIKFDNKTLINHINNLNKDKLWFKSGILYKKCSKQNNNKNLNKNNFFYTEKDTKEYFNKYYKQLINIIDSSFDMKKINNLNNTFNSIKRIFLKNKKYINFADDKIFNLEKVPTNFFKILNIFNKFIKYKISDIEDFLVYLYNFQTELSLYIINELYNLKNSLINLINLIFIDNKLNNKKLINLIVFSLYSTNYVLIGNKYRNLKNYCYNLNKKSDIDNNKLVDIIAIYQNKSKNFLDKILTSEVEYVKHLNNVNSNSKIIKKKNILNTKKKLFSIKNFINNSDFLHNLKDIIKNTVQNKDYNIGCKYFYTYLANNLNNKYNISKNLLTSFKSDELNIIQKILIQNAKDIDKNLIDIFSNNGKFFEFKNCFEISNFIADSNILLKKYIQYSLFVFSKFLICEHIDICHIIYFLYINIIDGFKLEYKSFSYENIQKFESYILNILDKLSNYLSYEIFNYFNIFIKSDNKNIFYYIVKDFKSIETLNQFIYVFLLAIFNINKYNSKNNVFKCIKIII